MTRATDHSLRTFGRLTPVVRNGSQGGHAVWRCLCECGNVCDVAATNLVSGKIESCGCLHREIQIVHSHSSPRSGTYRSWDAMTQRCGNPNHMSYPKYGGRGIKVCERWRDFKNFLEDMGERPDGLTLDRFPDYNGNYEPGNCRWATAKEQANNKRPRSQ